MDHLAFPDSEARGRNGYSRAVTAHVFVHRDKIHVEIGSRRPVWLAPVFADAAALALMLTGQV